jgi:hypothetical protein
VLQGIGGLIGFAGLLLLFVSLAYLTYRGIGGTFAWPMLWLIAVSLGLGIVGRVTIAFAWHLAHRKQFHYDYERRVSRWIDDGFERTYTFDEFQSLAKTSNSSKV